MDVQKGTRPYWEMACDAFALMLNNQQNEAEVIFLEHQDNIIMQYGYAASTFMDAIMSFEDEKLAKATQTLKDTEKRCTSPGWFRKGPSDNQPYADYLESQIIKADCEMYLATLTFLQLDISAYFKGGWMLRKSWKNYQQTYSEIEELYKRIVGDGEDTGRCRVLNLTSSVGVQQPEEPSPDPITSNLQSLDVAPTAVNGVPEEEQPSSSSDISTPPQEAPSKITHNGYIKRSQTMQFNANNNHIVSNNTLRKSRSFNSALARRFAFNGHTFSLSYMAGLGSFGGRGERLIEMDKESITRLMTGVSFGYGLMQLGMSLLPPSVHRFSTLLGFQGSRQLGLANLNYARSGHHMRAPMAILGLLWYHAVVRPFFAVDDNNAATNIANASELIDESMKEYSESAIFLFFKGRVDRLKSDIPSAITAFNTSIANASHREMRVLSTHEVGWCYLIQLEYESAFNKFSVLCRSSRWSRGFYTYLCIITEGARRQEGVEMETMVKSEFPNVTPGTQLMEFLRRRYRVCLRSHELAAARFWRLLAYEIIYLWNSMPSCSEESLHKIIDDCQEASEDETREAFLGMGLLMEGSALNILSRRPEAVEVFRACLARRRVCPINAPDAYVSAFAHYELGSLLIKTEDTKAEGKHLLEQVSQFKDYDFENRLTVRVNSILKHL